MPGIRLRYPPPANEADFERLCLAVLKRCWACPELELYGRRGEEQFGVDIVDTQSGVRAAQCKLFGSAKALPPAVIEAEVAKARGFSPPLSLYCILTTAKQSTRTQGALLDLNDRHKRDGSFRVEVLTWDQIEDLLDENDDVRNRFYDTASGRTIARFEQRLATIQDTLVQTKAASEARDATAEEGRLTEKLKEGRGMVDGGALDVAAALFEEATKLAQSVGDAGRERESHLLAARSWGDYVVLARAEEPRRGAALASIAEHIEAAEKLGSSPADIAVERALLARLQGQPEATVRWAQAAMDRGGDDHEIRVNAIVAYLQGLWQLGEAEKCLGFAEQVDGLRAELEGDALVVLEATWLRTLCKAEAAPPEAVEAFAGLVSDAVTRGGIPRRRAAVIAGEVASEFNRSDRADDARLLCELAYEVIEPAGEARMATTIATQIAELAAASGDADSARLYLGRSEHWQQRSEPIPRLGTAGSLESLRAVCLFARGRILARLGLGEGTAPRPDRHTLVEAHEALTEARSYAAENRSALSGDVELYLADTSWWLGRVADALGRNEEAADWFQRVRSDSAMAHPEFSVAVAFPAWLREAESLRLAGRLREARVVTGCILSHARLPEPVADRAQQFAEYLDARELPLLDWLESDAADNVGRQATGGSLNECVAKQLAPLVSWWKEWRSDEVGPESELMDFWGRGGFARVAAAVRARPHSAVAVDARSAAEIERWAQILCPLFDTVIVKWKGELGSGIVLAPIHDQYGGSDAFGGHGYRVTSGQPRDGWHVALSWANPIPRTVTAFLASEALPLVEAGRLVVLPAPLVGCTQSAVGWTDDILMSNLLRGVINVGRRAPDGALGNATRQGCDRNLR